jgi:hypothetical protein
MAAKVSNHFQKMMQDEIDRLATQMKMAHEQVQGKPVNSVDVSGNDPEMEKLAQPGTAKPAVTAEQYARGREVLDALPPGVYLKCSSCFKWQMGGDISFRGGGGFLCEKCA